MCGNYGLGLSNAKTPVEVLLVIHDFQPRLMNYVKVSGEKSVFVFAVDEWIFKRDVDRGFLGEALAGGLVFLLLTLSKPRNIHEEHFLCFPF